MDSLYYKLTIPPSLNLSCSPTPSPSNSPFLYLAKLSLEAFPLNSLSLPPSPPLPLSSLFTYYVQRKLSGNYTVSKTPFPYSPDAGYRRLQTCTSPNPPSHSPHVYVSIKTHLAYAAHCARRSRACVSACVRACAWRCAGVRSGYF